MKDLCTCGNEKDCRAKNCRPCSSQKLRTNFKCSVEGCDKDAWSKNLCPMHLRRLKKHGDVKTVTKGPEGPAWNYRGPYSGCWEWTGHFINKGREGREYGFVMIDYVRSLVHRLSWEAVNGEIPAGLEVCHGCDNTKCWRPDHLFLGTHKENMEDKVKKGRQNLNFAIGFRLPQTKLSEDEVIEIRSMWETGKFTQIEMAARFNVSRNHINRIINNKTRKILDASREYRKLSKLKVWEKYTGICGICSLPADFKDYELDHIIPLSRGGSDTYDNVQVAHPRCNRQKGNKMTFIYNNQLVTTSEV